MNWQSVNLDDNYERDQNIIDPLSFDTLLLEINCNCKDINEATVRQQFETDLKSRIASAREVFEMNLKNIVRQAKQESLTND